MRAHFVLEQELNWKQAITWLIGFSALSGPIAGIMSADYFVYRKRQLQVAEVHKPAPNPVTQGASVGGINRAYTEHFAESARVRRDHENSGAIQGGATFLLLYQYAWFAGFTLALILYLPGRNLAAPDSRRTI